MRRTGILVATMLIATPGPLRAQSVDSDQLVTRPVIAEEVSPLESISPIASDGHNGQGFLRKPPGDGPFPAVVLLHGGMVEWETERLRDFALRAHPSRFLEAGYVVAVMTYRSRDIDPQTEAPLLDALAAVEYVRQLPYVDADSIAIRGTSGGGDLALSVAAVADVAAIAAEEPASMIFMGLFNASLPKSGERYTSAAVGPIMADPHGHYTTEFQELTRAKMARIESPILIIQGDQNPLPFFNEEILIPELRTAGKDVTVITYRGEPHSFAYYSLPNRTPRPAVALKAFNDVDEFLRSHLTTQPRPIDPAFVQHVPW